MSLTLLDWRRRVARLYAEVRGEPDIRAAHDHWRQTRDDLLRTHPDSPIPPSQRASYPGAPVAAYDPRLRFDVAVDTDVPPRHLDLATSSDGIVPFDRIGRAHLPGYGDLDVWWLGSYGGGVFVPVKDATAGVTTYGGGRYLIDTVKGADLGGDDGRLILDINFAYNPSCAYDPAWACPLAPAGNTLSGPLQAGELVSLSQSKARARQRAGSTGPPGGGPGRRWWTNPLAKEEPCRAGNPVAKIVPLARRIDRDGRGSLRGQLVAADDWDSDEVNEAIARDFGMTR